MKTIDKDFKILHTKLESGDYDAQVRSVVDAWIDLLGAENVQSVEIYTSDLWDPYYAHFHARAWVRRTPIARGHCQNCGQLIRTMIFKGTDWCSDNCRKDLQRRE